MILADRDIKPAHIHRLCMFSEVEENFYYDEKKCKKDLNTHFKL